MRGMRALAVALLSAGCGDGEAEETTAWDPDTGSGSGDATSSSSAASAESEATDAPADTTGGPAPELVEVSHDRELRAAWVATVSNINFPSSQGLPVDAMQAELVGYLDTLVSANMNAIVFQVRPECDALYASDLEPWSRFLTGSQGGDPGFDPLEYLIAEALPRGIEVHAWLNPYRAAVSAGSPLVSPHVALAFPEYAYVYGNFLWMDPGADPVRQHDVDVILDVVDRYDLDGIHFDDYFYPYPNGDAFPDGTTYGAYQDGGGALGLGDWRRDNVNQLVEALGSEIAAAKPWVRFGISPFGIYQPGMPAGITGLNQYEEIFADPVKWIQEGWVDYIAPQLYWPTTQTAQAYEPLVEWWVSVAPEGRNVFVGNFLSQLGTSEAWTTDELLAQIELSRMYQLDSWGNIFFHIAPLVDNQDGFTDALVADYYTQPVLTPVMWAHREDIVEPPIVTIDGTGVTVEPGSDEPLRAWVVYRDDGAGFVLDRIVPVGEGGAIELGTGRWAVSAAARTGAESLGVLVEL